MRWRFQLWRIAVSAVFVINGHLLGTNDFEPLLWMGCASVVIRIVQTGNQKLWLWFGVIAGVGLLNKYSISIFGAGIVVGLVLTQERKALAHKWIWICGAHRASDLPAELHLECSARLAIRAIDAQHPSERPRCGTEPCQILSAADPDGQSVRVSTVGSWARVALLRQRRTSAIACWDGLSL